MREKAWELNARAQEYQQQMLTLLESQIDPHVVIFAHLRGQGIETTAYRRVLSYVLPARFTNNSSIRSNIINKRDLL